MEKAPVLLSARQRALVRRTFGSLARCQAEAEILYFDKLFELDPSLRPLFPKSLAARQRKMMHALARAVHSPDDPDALRQFLASTGVHPPDPKGCVPLALCEQALLWTIARCLGAAYTPDVGAAWEMFFRQVRAAL